MADNAVGVMVTGDDFDKVTTAKRIQQLLLLKTQEMLFQFNQTFIKITVDQS